MRRTRPKNIKFDRQGEKRTVVRSTILSTLLRIGIVAALFVCWSRRQPGLMKTVLLALAITNLITIPFTFAALWQRVKEIEKGELDEARKY